MRDNRNLLGHIARKNSFRLKHFQLNHLSRLLIKGRGMLAHEPGLGKCVSGDTPVLVNGTLIRAEEVWSRYASEDRQHDGEGEWTQPTADLSTAALAASGHMTDARISCLYRQWVAEYGRRVCLDDGSEITITNRHKLHGADGWTLDVRAGDKVCVPRHIPNTKEYSPDPEAVELLAWQIAEGWESPNLGIVMISQKNVGRLKRLRDLAQRVARRHGISANSTPINRGGEARSTHLRITSRAYRTWLETMFGTSGAAKALANVSPTGSAPPTMLPCGYFCELTWPPKVL